MLPDVLSVFPGLLTYGILAPVVLRVTVGYLFVRMGHLHGFKLRGQYLGELRARWRPGFSKFFIWYLALFEIVVGLLLIIGLFTQVAALVGAIIALKLPFLKRMNLSLARESGSYYALLFVICISLVVTGAGAFAIDLPL
jgi:uncharacterized membrane protein YphA (DoxX/SURF4 family)